MDKWLRSNNTIRVVAVLVGILLWVIVRLDVQNSTGPTQPTTVSQKYTDVSIQVVGLDENRFTMRSIEPRKVSLTVIGTAASLRRVNIDQYQVKLNLADALPGETLMPLYHDGFPNGVEVVLDPPNVAVTLDEKERKEMPVTINIIGSPADGFTAGLPVVQPNRVNVTVSSSLADEVASVVGLIDIDGATESVNQQVKVVALNADGTELDVEVSPAVVQVEVPITSPFKTMPLQISLEGVPPPGFAVGAFEQSASEVTVFGPQAFLNSLEFYEGLRIDLSTLKVSKTFEFDVPIRSGVERVLPEKVTAQVTIVPAVSQILKALTITLNGASDDYDYLVTTPESGVLDVIVEAAPDVIATLAPEDVKVLVDVSNLPPGVYELPIDYSLPSLVKTAAENPAMVTVEVKTKSEEAATETGTLPEGETSGGTPPPGPVDGQGEGNGAAEPGLEPTAAGRTEPGAL